MPKPLPHLLLFSLMLLILPCMAMAQDSASLNKYLQDYVGKPLTDTDKEMRYLDAWIDLNSDGKQEVIVYLLGWRGSGGCGTLILEPQGSSFRVVTYITIVKLPIRVLATKSHGWNNLTVFVQGGGITRGYDAELRFNGKKYPSNPTVYPARPLLKNAEGSVLISRDEYEHGKPLYP
jgi:hypothetical protein